MLSIKNNLMAEVASRHLGKSYNSLAKSVERLSSGLRINSAKDDAAGLAVRELIRADVAALRQGSRNAADGISMLQTAEGALGAVDDILVRMEELAEQACTQTYSTAQVEIMEKEFMELSKEIDRIAENTAFNEKKLLNDDTATYDIHVGAGATIQISGKKMTASELKVGGTVEYMAGRSVSNVADDYFTGDLADDAVSFKFDQDGAGDDQTITVTVDATTFGLDDVVTALNAQSRALKEGWNAASAEYNSSTGQYTLKLTNWATGDITGISMSANTGAVEWATAIGGDAVADTHFAKTDGAADVDLVNNASGALTKVQDAIKAKDLARAEFGYMMNRLEAAISVVDIQAENLAAAESRISDVDVATEMAAMTRNQVLAQAGISMLAQANMIPQMALNLLG